MKQFFVSLVEDGLHKFVRIKRPETIRFFPNAEDTLYFLKLLNIDISGNFSGHDIDGGSVGFTEAVWEDFSDVQHVRTGKCILLWDGNCLTEL